MTCSPAALPAITGNESVFRLRHFLQAVGEHASDRCGSSSLTKSATKSRLLYQSIQKQRFSGKKRMNDDCGHFLWIDVNRQSLFEAESQVNMRFAADSDRFNHETESASPEQAVATDHLIDVLKSPTAVFSGLNRANFAHDSYCYVGKIDEFAAGFVFLVFAKKMPECLFVIDWCFRPADPRRRELPNNWRNDFGDIIWPVPTRR